MIFVRLFWKMSPSKTFVSSQESGAPECLPASLLQEPTEKFNHKRSVYSVVPWRMCPKTKAVYE